MKIFILNTSLIQGRSKIQPKLLITNQEVRKSLFSSDNVNQMFFQMFDHGWGLTIARIYRWTYDTFGFWSRWPRQKKVFPNPRDFCSWNIFKPLCFWFKKDGGLIIQMKIWKCVKIDLKNIFLFQVHFTNI